MIGFLVSLTCVFFNCIPIYCLITHYRVRYHFRGMWFMMLMKKHQIEVEDHHMRSIRHIVLALVPIIVANKNPTALFCNFAKKIHTYIYQLLYIGFFMSPVQ